MVAPVRLLYLSPGFFQLNLFKVDVVARVRLLYLSPGFFQLNLFKVDVVARVRLLYLSPLHSSFTDAKTVDRMVFALKNLYYSQMFIAQPRIENELTVLSI